MDSLPGNAGIWGKKAFFYSSQRQPGTAIMHKLIQHSYNSGATQNSIVILILQMGTVDESQCLIKAVY